MGHTFSATWWMVSGRSIESILKFRAHKKHLQKRPGAHGHVSCQVLIVILVNRQGNHIENSIHFGYLIYHFRIPRILETVLCNQIPYLSKLRRVCSNLGLRYAFPTITIRSSCYITPYDLDSHHLAPPSIPQNPGKVALGSPRKLRSAKDAVSCGGTLPPIHAVTTILMVYDTHESIHGTGWYTYIYHTNPPNVNIAYMDGLLVFKSSSLCWADASIASVTGPLSANCATGSLHESHQKKFHTAH